MLNVSQKSLQNMQKSINNKLLFIIIIVYWFHSDFFCTQNWENGPKNGPKRGFFIPERWAKMFSSNQIAGFFNQPYLQNKSLKKPDFVHPAPFLPGGGGGVEPPTQSSKRGAWKCSICHEIWMGFVSIYELCIWPLYILWMWPFSFEWR